MCALLLKMENLAASNTCVRHSKSLSTIIMLTEDTVVDAGASCICGLCGVPTTPTGLLRTPAQKKAPGPRPRVLTPLLACKGKLHPSRRVCVPARVGRGRDGSRGEGQHQRSGVVWMVHGTACS